MDRVREVGVQLVAEEQVDAPYAVALVKAESSLPVESLEAFEIVPDHGGSVRTVNRGHLARLQDLGP